MSSTPPPPADARPNIVLTGFMGTGKTTVGRLLAVRIGYGFVDTDTVIEERYGPIPDIFATRGQPAFRAMEREVAGEIAGESGLVVATGGRLMLDEANADALGATGYVFCLTAEVDELLRRVTTSDDADQRPLLAGPDPAARVRELLDERRDQYARFTRIDTTGRSPDDVVTAILDHLQIPEGPRTRPQD